VSPSISSTDGKIGRGVVARELDGKVAVVTGAARGIGLAVARRLAEEGARVANWDLRDAPDEPSIALHETVDVTDNASVEAAVHRTVAALGGIDILVNNAGVNGPTLPTQEYPLEAWDKVLAVDLTGVFLCCRAVLPHMLAAGSGRIVNIASIAAKEGNARAVAYSAAKAGVVGLTKAIARETIKDGITVNAIAPAMAETELLQEMDADYIEDIKRRMPAGRLVRLEEIADMVAFVAGPRCGYTSGQIFDVTGGRATW
jgi:NAD(P)-dependent dehydrogenase (short-subunit alcohol dehydrogenase family)